MLQLSRFYYKYIIILKWKVSNMLLNVHKKWQNLLG